MHSRPFDNHPHYVKDLLKHPNRLVHRLNVDLIVLCNNEFPVYNSVFSIIVLFFIINYQFGKNEAANIKHSGAYFVFMFE